MKLFMLLALFSMGCATTVGDVDYGQGGELRPELPPTRTVSFTLHNVPEGCVSHSLPSMTVDMVAPTGCEQATVEDDGPSVRTVSYRCGVEALTVTLAGNAGVATWYPTSGSETCAVTYNAEVGK